MPSSKSPPWKRPRPARRPTHLSPAAIAWARARAGRAGRRYPNLVDNMAAATHFKAGSSPKRPASTKRKPAKRAASTQRKPAKRATSAKRTASTKRKPAKPTATTKRKPAKRGSR